MDKFMYTHVFFLQAFFYDICWVDKIPPNETNSKLNNSKDV